MSNGNVFERLIKLLASILKMVVDGKRDPKLVADHLQLIVDAKWGWIWKPWKTIKLGTGLRNAEDFLKAIKQAGVQFGETALFIFGVPVSSEEVYIELIKTSLDELGLYGSAPTYEDVCVRAKVRGLELCPKEVIPQLRLQYTDQPQGEQLAIATKIVIVNGDPRLFYVSRDELGQWIHSIRCNPKDVLTDNLELVFIRRKSSK